MGAYSFEPPPGDRPVSPWAPPRACLSPRCPLFALPGKSRCQAHQAEYYRQDNAQRDPGLTAFYASTVWKKTRALFRAANPLCEICATEGRETLAQQVDHRVPVREDPDRALDPTNLRALCMSCHSRRTRLAEHRGGPMGGGR